MKSLSFIVCVFLCFLWLFFASPVSAIAQTSYPMITHVTPVAVQRGKTVEVTVEGQMNFAGAYKALFEGPASPARCCVQPARRWSPRNGRWSESVKLKVTVAADAAARRARVSAGVVAGRLQRRAAGRRR